MRDRCFPFAIWLVLVCSFALVLAGGPAAADIVSLVSIGCDTIDATQMAEAALRDQYSGKDPNAFDRITAYRKQAGQQACRPLSQGDEVSIVHTQEPYVCVQEHDERLLRPGDPECYWILHRHLKLPDD